jgi:Zn-dependent peptidase ImmA (M78 family)
MSSSVAFENLRELRETLVYLRIDTVARETGIAVERLRAIELGANATVYEAEHLAALYGVDFDALYDTPIRVSATDCVGALPSLEEFREQDDLVRVKILRAASAAQDVVKLRRLLGQPVIPLPVLPTPLASDTPHRQGASLAHALRAHLGLGVEPIASVRDLVAERLPGVAVLYADLGAGSLAGLGFADENRGPAIVLNLFGKNAHPSVRRFSLCHELCHLIADWNRREALVSISGFYSENALEREQRANAFAVRFLCPEAVVHKLAKSDPLDAARTLIVEYGLSWGAARLYLRNEADILLDQTPPSAFSAVNMPDPQREAAECAKGMDDAFPLREVPFARRGVLAQLVVQAWGAGMLSRDAAAGLLAVPASAALIRVANYFDVDVPTAATA